MCESREVFGFMEGFPRTFPLGVSPQKMEHVVSEDFYHDDPIEEVSKTKVRSKVLSTAALIVGSIFFFQSTLAGNISLNSGRGIEFGQSVSQAVACSGETSLTLTPRSTFINGSPGAHYLQSVTVSNIPTSCYGDDFTINAYGDSSSTPLALFNATSTDAVVYNNNGTFQMGKGITGLTISSGSGAFTITFTNPVAQSSSILKLTIQSGLHSVYRVGERGPGGGTIFYVSPTSFNCGPTVSARCTYLEVAPNGWNGGSDPNLVWGNQNSDSNVTNNSNSDTSESGIGLGYKNSLALVSQNGDGTTHAAGAARAYTGGSNNDWYLPTQSELNLLCQWARGVAANVALICNGGSINSPTYGASSAGFGGAYWSSSEHSMGSAWRQLISSTGGVQLWSKDIASLVRPVRAF